MLSESKVLGRIAFSVDFAAFPDPKDQYQPISVLPDEKYFKLRFRIKVESNPSFIVDLRLPHCRRWVCLWKNEEEFTKATTSDLSKI